MTVKADIIKKAVTAVIILVNLLLWLTPSDLAYNVAQQRDILLGRYTVEKLTTLLLLIPISLLIIKGIWSNKKEKKSQKQKREQLFKIAALTFSIIFTILAVDVLMRFVQRSQYLKERSFYHRVPNVIQKGINKDIPPTAFSYPTTPAGYHDIPYTLTIDKNGFRNQTVLEKYDVVVLGDSFTEGSGISDDQTWPVLFAKKNNCNAYNLGMSAGSPLTYLETLKKFGLALSPKSVICMLYEGNDFRASNFSQEKIKRRPTLRTLFRASPLRQSIKKALISCLGPVNSSRSKKPTNNKDNKTEILPPYHPLYPVSWLPLAVPDEPEPKYYAFKIKRLLSHFETKDNFKDSAGCQATFTALRKIKEICNQNNIRFIVMYAPDKPHTLLPLVRHKLSPQMLHEFMALKNKNLPPPGELMDVLLPSLSVQESALGQFCRTESIEFVSLTNPLQQEILNGRQAFFTYDQHWTPIGHEVAADTLYQYIQNQVKKGIPITY